MVASDLQIMAWRCSPATDWQVFPVSWRASRGKNAAFLVPGLISRDGSYHWDVDSSTNLLLLGLKEYLETGRCINMALIHWALSVRTGLFTR